jgi:hypothetical protein
MLKASAIIICIFLITLTSQGQSKKGKRASSKTTTGKVKSNVPSELDLFFAEHDPGGSWDYIGESTDEKYYYDKDRIKYPYANVTQLWIGVWPSVEGVKRGLWRKKVIERRKKTGESVKGWELYYRHIDLYQVNCKDKTLRMIGSTSYDSLGDVLDSFETNRGSFGNPIPNSIGEGIVQAACKKEK